MQSLAICARLVARAVSGTEAENFLYNSLLRLSTSSSVHHPQSPSNRPAISSSPSITRAVHLVTATSGYSGHDDDDDDSNENQKGQLRKKKNSSKIQRTNRSNGHGDDAFFVAKNRLGDFLGMYKFHCYFFFIYSFDNFRCC